MNKNFENTDPPKWADRFFEWYCNPDMQEEIQGDLYESFMDMVKHSGVKKAKRWYWLQVFLFINRHTLSRDNNSFTHLNSIDMFRSYFKIGFRNILKNKGTTFINAFGMALAIGCCLVAYQFVDTIFGMDDFHEKLEEIYIVHKALDENGEQVIWSDVPMPLGPTIKNDFAQISDVVRVNYNRGVMEYEDHVFSESIAFVDSSFFDLFDFPIKWGNEANFMHPEGIVLGARKAEKYFGSNNPIGKTLVVRFNQNGKEIITHFIVQGVLEKTPDRPSFSPSAIVPFHRQKIILSKLEDWSTSTDITFVQAKNPSVIDHIRTNEKTYLETMNAANENWKAVGLQFRPFKNLVLNNSEVRNPLFGFTDKAAVYGLMFIAFALLILVCFNYINIALAAASTRLKEISVRKVMGSTRQQIIWQFITENVIICLMAMILGVVLAYHLFLPWFNTILDGLTLQFAFTPQLCLFLLGLTLITALGGAGYPALYISKFQPNDILKQAFKLGNKNNFRKILVGIQLTLTIITIFSTFVFLIDAQKQQQKDWGYNQKDLAVIQLKDGRDFDKFKTDIQSNANVLSVAGSQEQLGNFFQPLVVTVNGEEYDVQNIHVDENYLPTFDIQLLEGRNFSQQFEADIEQSVIVNEAFRKRMNWETATGKNFKIGTKNYTIIGETANFHTEDFYHSVKPMVLQLAEQEALRYVTVRTQPKTTETTAKALKNNWKKIYPHTPYNYAFQDGVFFIYFNKYTQTTSILSAVAFIAILISIIGFFGLAMLLLNKKMKELSIRKVLGAGSFHISHLINKEFFLPLLVALFIGLTIGFRLNMNLLQTIFSPDASIGILPFLLTIGCICLMLVVSLAKHIHTAIVSSPSTFLKDE